MIGKGRERKIGVNVDDDKRTVFLICGKPNFVWRTSNILTEIGSLRVHKSLKNLSPECVCLRDCIYLCERGVPWCTQQQYSQTIENPIVVGGLGWVVLKRRLRWRLAGYYFLRFFSHKKDSLHLCVCITVCYFIPFGSVSSTSIPSFICTVFFSLFLFESHSKFETFLPCCLGFKVSISL